MLIFIVVIHFWTQPKEEGAKPWPDLKEEGYRPAPKWGQVVAGPKEKRGPGRPWLDPKEIGNWVEARPKEKWVLPPQKEWVLTGPKGIWAEARPKDK